MKPTERTEEWLAGYAAGVREKRGKLANSSRNNARRECLYNLMIYLTEKIESRRAAGLQCNREQREASAIEEALRRWDAYEEVTRG